MTGTTSKPRQDFHVEGHGLTVISESGSGFSLNKSGFFRNGNPQLGNPTVTFYTSSFLITVAGLNTPTWSHNP